VKNMENEQVRELRIRLQEKHPDWPEDKIRWLAGFVR